MGFKCGIVGLPNVGKSTLFNALTQAGIAADNYPFCTIEPNVGVVPVPDPRLAELAQIVKPQKTIPTSIEFVDIAGLVAGAAKGEGLGNQFLAHIREVDAIAHVVRCFEDEDIIHISGTVDPITDIQIIQTELALTDLETAGKVLTRLNRVKKKVDPNALATKSLLSRLTPSLNEGVLLRDLNLSAEERGLLAPYHFLTLKEVLYIANVDERGFMNNPLLDAVETFAQQHNAQVVPLCAKLEEDFLAFSEEERIAFLQELGLKETGLNRLICAGYALLNLQTFFTTGVKEVQVWTIPKGATAPQAAGRIHSDFEKGFIRAEVIGYADFIQYHGEQGAKEAGKWRLEGKLYVVTDGDILHFLFNV